MGLFSKKNKNITFVSPVKGQLIPLEKVQDAVFSQKMMGDGFAIEPSAESVVSPVDGKISSIFPTKHALMIATDTGLEVMIHLGLDTVELNGEPFEIFVKSGDKIQQGQKLASMDLEQIRAKGKLTTVLVIISNMDQVKSLTDISEQDVDVNTEVMTAKTK